MKRLSLLALASLMACTLTAQTSIGSEGISTEQDSSLLDSMEIHTQFSLPEAWVYVDHMVQTDTLWHSQKDSVRLALQRLLDHSIEPYDSVRSRLMSEDFSKLEVKVNDSITTGSISLRWLNDSTFIVDPKGWSPDLYLKSTVFIDSSALSEAPQVIPDTVLITSIDTFALESLGISLHNYIGDKIIPSLDSVGRKHYMNPDRSMLSYYIPADHWNTVAESPFGILESETQLDSLQLAINKLLQFTGERDSVILWVDDLHGNKHPFWLKQGDDKAYRFWVKNYNNDSLTIWIGNPAPNEISLAMEEDVRINRLAKEDIRHLPEFVELPQRSLLSMQKLEPEPVYWNYSFGSVFSMNQTYLSNWSKGGESSFSTMVDLLGEATYNNKDAKTQWINSIRLNFGTLSTKENGFRKNNDLFEINSKFNGNAWGKIGMSSSFYMKNQLAKGYNYPNDSVIVSKFLNPASLTVGLGFEYKPFKNTTLNIAPLSYKITFVLDTAQIDQTAHGIEEGNMAKQELGTQIVLGSKFNPTKDLTIENRLRLFSNYLNKPQNVDVDWELIMDQKINWFFTIRLNLHLIYDDDVRFTMYDSEGMPIMLPDGSEKKVAKTQFKEFIGLSLQFKF